MSLISANPRRAALAALVALPLAAGCGSAGSDSAGVPVVNVTEKDFHISAPARVAAGEMILRVRNDGPDEHELIAARAPANWKLPIRGDGFTVDEDAVQASEPGSLEPGAPNATRTLRVKLAPGKYVFFCNMAGHFMGGMHADVVVA
jgi:plastocyanin